MVRILSIDGGGIRGIIPGQIAVLIEKLIQKKTNNPKAKIADYFDFLAGTSTGGILVGVYLTPDDHNPEVPKYSAQQAVDLYMQKGPAIFSISTWKKFTSMGGLNEEIYSEIPLERYLKVYFKDLTLKDLVKPCIITAYEIEKRKPYFFSRDNGRYTIDRNFYMRDVCRATSAAPIYFKASHIYSTTKHPYYFVDGGLFANNPTMCALTEALKKFSFDDKNLTIENTMTLSLGTGYKKVPIDYDDAKDYGAIGWVKPILHIMSTGNNETVDHQVENLYASLNKENQYLRLSPLLVDASAELDDASPENLISLTNTATNYFNENFEKIDKFVDQLINVKPELI